MYEKPRIVTRIVRDTTSIKEQKGSKTQNVKHRGYVQITIMLSSLFGGDTERGAKTDASGRSDVRLSFSTVIRETLPSLLLLLISRYTIDAHWSISELETRLGSTQAIQSFIVCVFHVPAAKFASYYIVYVVRTARLRIAYHFTLRVNGANRR